MTDDTFGQTFNHFEYDTHFRGINCPAIVCFQSFDNKAGGGGGQFRKWVQFYCAEGTHPYSSLRCQHDGSVSMEDEQAWHAQTIRGDVQMMHNFTP